MSSNGSEGTQVECENPKWAGIGSKYAHLTSVHPCFGIKAHFKAARIHLPVAPRCNIQCNYCTRKIDKCEHRPGVAACLMDEKAAVSRLRSEMKSNPNLKVVGIAGPGDALANEATFRTLEAAVKNWPDLVACLSTNGLLAEESAERLSKIGVKTVTMTVNAIDPEVVNTLTLTGMADGDWQLLDDPRLVLDPSASIHSVVKVFEAPSAPGDEHHSGSGYRKGGISAVVDYAHWRTCFWGDSDNANIAEDCGGIFDKLISCNHEIDYTVAWDVAQFCNLITYAADAWTVTLNTSACDAALKDED
ncbi:MAG TPA: radical SAM protein, partial [Candidatus Methanomethylicus sp.]|nr:radical SAM protein [Candidatus Methanomethylicus sp.]